MKKLDLGNWVCGIIDHYWYRRIIYAKDIANQTLFSDGWIILLLGGLICAVLGWFVTRVAILFPKQNFVQYTSAHLTKPVAYTISSILVLTFAALTAYESRMISIISQTYLFSDTPIQLLSFFSY